MSYSNGPGIAIYSQDGFGLGHLRRNSVIGQHLLEEMPKSKILLFADSPVAPVFQLPEGMDHIKLPSINKVRTGTWQPTHLRIRVSDPQRIRAELLRKELLLKAQKPQQEVAFLLQRGNFSDRQKERLAFGAGF